jgi:hypothetical protein
MQPTPRLTDKFDLALADQLLNGQLLDQLEHLPGAIRGVESESYDVCHS